MKNFSDILARKTSPSFALISVLALVSLAALTATAFLASARLERQASSSIGKTTLVDMALDSAKYCVCQLINDYAQTDMGNTHIVTYWRTNKDDELGWPFIAKVKTSGSGYGQSSAAWYYTPLFSPAGVKRLDTTDIQDAMRFTNSHQGTFSNDMTAYMTNATNKFTNAPGLTNLYCVQIPLLGGRTSPPVGWVYIDQEKRRPGLTNTYTSSVVRIAWFTEDLEGLIDAERMGALAVRSTGTNSEEISISSARDTNDNALISTPAIPAFITNRNAYISYGLLASLSGLANPTNARYFARGLRSWSVTNPTTPNGALEWIPTGIPIKLSGKIASGYTNQGYTKISLNRMISDSNALKNIASVITNNLPNFTNRAGGMNGTNYAYALAANIIDYADENSSPTSTNITGVNIAGFDNYPMLTHVFDQFLYSQNNKEITITTYLQFWNPSSASTPALSGGTFSYNLNDTIRYPTSLGPPILYTNIPLSSIALPNANFSFSSGAGVTHIFGTNSGFITSITNKIDLTTFPDFPNPAPMSVDLNTTDGSTTDNRATNNFTLTGLGATNRLPLPLSLYRDKVTLNNNAPIWMGSILNLRMHSGVGANGTNRLCADPRMLNYIGDGKTDRIANATYPNVYWQGYPSELTTDLLSGHPGNWPDGYNTTNNPMPTRGINNPAVPPPGAFKIQDPLTLIADPPPCKISNSGSYSNILELGNIFDPIQWSPPADAQTTNYANCNINTNAGSVWSKNSLYGGGSTLRIGRPEHSLFAFTNFGSGYPIPNMGMSAAALLDLFSISNGTSVTTGTGILGAGKINLNTAPAPVLAALAGDIALSRDPSKAGSEVSTNMIKAFTNGVMRFRHLYPFLSPSQLLFISANYGTTNWTNSSLWNSTAVFSLNQGLAGITSINDEGREEWFSKIYALSSCQSHNFRIYVVAQLVATNKSGETNAIGPLVKKYYQVYFQNGSAVSQPSKWNGTNTTYTGNNIYTWTPTGYTIDISQSPY